jgi:hypothetical protein
MAKHTKHNDEYQRRPPATRLQFFAPSQNNAYARVQNGRTQTRAGGALRRNRGGRRGRGEIHEVLRNTVARRSARPVALRRDAVVLHDATRRPEPQDCDALVLDEQDTLLDAGCCAYRGRDTYGKAASSTGTSAAQVAQEALTLLDQASSLLKRLRPTRRSRWRAPRSG